MIQIEKDLDKLIRYIERSKNWYMIDSGENLTSISFSEVEKITNDKVPVIAISVISQGYAITFPDGFSKHFDELRFQEVFLYGQYYTNVLFFQDGGFNNKGSLYHNLFIDFEKED